MLLIVVFIFIVIIGKVFYIEVVEYGKLNNLASNLWSRNLPIEADRGKIYTVDGEVIAGNLTTVSLVFVPNQIKNKNLVLYAKSNLVDMLGFTSSPKEMWLNYNIDLEELKEDYEDTKNNIDLFEILDEEHFKYVDEENSIKHYQLIVDKDLLLKLENKLSDETKETLEITKNQESVVENMIYYVDFYINRSYEITKISIDMTDQIMDETYKKFVLEFEFMNFGKTNLEIPKEAKESTMNIENYMTTYSLYQEIEENTLSN